LDDKFTYGFTSQKLCAQGKWSFGTLILQALTNLGQFSPSHNELIFQFLFGVIQENQINERMDMGTSTLGRLACNCFFVRRPWNVV
jgi:hypothetical protein